MKKAFKFSRNAFGIRIKQTCFVCSHCEMERAINVRKCNKHNKKVSKGSVCDDWNMNEPLSKAGGPSRGRIKKLHYLLYVLDIRVNEEQQQEESQETVAVRSIEEIRKEYEELFGSIYINF